MGEECSLPQDVSNAKLRTHLEQDISPHPFATWVRDALQVAYDHVRESLHRTAARRKRLYDIKAVNQKFPVTILSPAAQHKLGYPWIGPNQVVRQATSHTVGIQRNPEKPIVLYTWTILNYVRTRKTSNGVLAFLPLNHYALVR